MNSAFLVFAVLLNGAFALLVFWWVFRELRRGREDERPGAGGQSRGRG